MIGGCFERVRFQADLTETKIFNASEEKVRNGSRSHFIMEITLHSTNKMHCGRFVSPYVNVWVIAGSVFSIKRNQTNFVSGFLGYTSIGKFTDSATPQQDLCYAALSIVSFVHKLFSELLIIFNQK